MEAIAQLLEVHRQRPERGIEERHEFERILLHCMKDLVGKINAFLIAR